MLNRLAYFVLIAALVASVPLQALWTGVPAEHAFCIGCEHNGGWSLTISEPCNPTEQGCCESEHGADESDDQSPSQPHLVSNCGCIDVALRENIPGAVSAPTRAAAPDREVFKGALPLTLALVLEQVKAAQCSPLSPRAGLWRDGSPPRLLQAPVAQSTILIV